MKKYYLHIIVVMGYFLFVAGSCGEEPEISGCTDGSACNYNIEATIDNGNCILSEENLDCNGNCIIQTDDGCECAVLYDECGFCDGDNSSCIDCNGEVNGDSILDMCETCDNDPSNDCVQDCAGVWGGSLVEDGCGVCDGDNSSCTGCMDEIACNYSLTATISGECEYSEINYDCSGNCNVEVDCAGVCGGSAIEDVCGICGGGILEVENCVECPESDPEDCAGVCGGILVDDDCGVCDGDNSSCTGCMDDTACNYSLNATISGECEYSEENYDCSGNCNVEVDCDGVCGGSAALDDCGLCNGESICDGQMSQGQCESGDFNVGEFNVSGFDCNGFCLGTQCFGDSTDCYGEEGADECYDCAGTPNSDAPAELDDCKICSGGESEHIANSDQDCTGECFGNSVLDECGICFGENDDWSEFGLSCYIGCPDENASNYYCDDDVNSCENDQPPEGFIDGETCTYNIEGTIEYYSNETAIEDVSVTIYGSSLESDSAIDTVITDSMGHFIIPHVPIRNTDDAPYEHYYFKYSYSEDSPPPVGDVQAELIVKVVVGIESFPTFLSDNEYTYGYHSSIAADVDLNDHINAFDATLIRRFESGASSSLNELDIRWKFVSEIDTIYDITNLTDYNNFLIHGVKLGDPHGYWEGE